MILVCGFLLCLRLPQIFKLFCLTLHPRFPLFFFYLYVNSLLCLWFSYLSFVTPFCSLFSLPLPLVLLRTVAFIEKNATVCHAHCMKSLPSAKCRGLSGVVASAKMQRVGGNVSCIVASPFLQSAEGMLQGSCIVASVFLQRVGECCSVVFLHCSGVGTVQGHAQLV